MINTRKIKDLLFKNKRSDSSTTVLNTRSRISGLTKSLDEEFKKEKDVFIDDFSSKNVSEWQEKIKKTRGKLILILGYQTAELMLDKVFAGVNKDDYDISAIIYDDHFGKKKPESPNIDYIDHNDNNDGPGKDKNIEKEEFKKITDKIKSIIGIKTANKNNGEVDEVEESLKKLI